MLYENFSKASLTPIENYVIWQETTHVQKHLREEPIGAILNRIVLVRKHSIYKMYP